MDAVLSEDDKTLVDPSGGGVGSAPVSPRELCAASMSVSLSQRGQVLTHVPGV